MLSLKEILAGVLLPGILGIFVLLVAWRPWNKRRTAQGNWGGAVAIALSFATAFCITFSAQGAVYFWPDFPPRSSEDWLVFGAIVLMFLGLMVALIQMPWWARAFLVFVGSLCLTAVVLRLQILNSWTVPQSFYWVGGVALATTIWTILTDLLADRISGVLLPILLTIVSGTSAVLLGMQGSQTLALTTGMITAGLGAFILVTLWSNRISISRGALFVAFPLLAACMVRGTIAAKFPLVHGGLVILACLMLWILHLPLIRTRGVWVRLVIGLVVIGVPLALALVPTVQIFLKDMREAGEMGGY